MVEGTSFAVGLVVGVGKDSKKKKKNK